MLFSSRFTPFNRLQANGGMLFVLRLNLEIFPIIQTSNNFQEKIPDICLYIRSFNPDVALLLYNFFNPVNTQRGGNS